MSGNALPFVGNLFLCVFDCICKYFSNTDQISNINTHPFVIFKYKYTNFF